MAIITLMTDFGIKDGNVGVMKGVILGIAPQAQIVDLSHMITRQNVQEATLILARSAPYFPDGSIHVVVVDPGVGTARRPIAARLGRQYFVGPDNGLLTLWLERVEAAGEETEFVHLDRCEYWLSDVSHVFHGRDIFAPAAAHLANGKALRELGSPVSDPLRLPFPRPERQGNTLYGEIIHVDHFGNAASNIRVEHIYEILQSQPAMGGAITAAIDDTGEPEGRLREMIDAVLQSGARFTLRLAGVEIDGLVNTFGERAPGEPVALFGSTGNLIASVVNGSFAAAYGVSPGQAVELRFEP